jgi:hypothetical protein
MAREANLAKYGDGLREGVATFIDALERFEALVRADERNRTWTQEHWTEYERSIAAAERRGIISRLLEIGALEDGAFIEAIRARGNT